MKYITTDGKYWIDANDVSAKVGVTKRFLNEYGILLVLDINQPVGKLIHKGQSIAAVEGISKLACMTSPVTGTLQNVNVETQDDPVKLTEDTVLFEFVQFNLAKESLREYYALPSM